MLHLLPILMGMKKSELYSIIREAVKNALAAQEAIGYDGLEEPKEVRKARLAGRAQARAKLARKSPEELEQAYLSIEQKAEKEYQDPVRSEFLRGAMDQVRDMLKKFGRGLPRKSSDPWTR